MFSPSDSERWKLLGPALPPRRAPLSNRPRLLALQRAVCSGGKGHAPIEQAGRVGAAAGGLVEEGVAAGAGAAHAVRPVRVPLRQATRAARASRALAATAPAAALAHGRRALRGEGAVGGAGQRVDQLRAVRLQRRGTPCQRHGGRTAPNSDARPRSTRSLGCGCGCGCGRARTCLP